MELNPKKLKHFYLLLYFLTPIIASLIYWFQEPVQFTFTDVDIFMKIEHNIASIMGIFSYIWMCYNIIIMVKVKVLEEILEIDKLITFHTRMAIIALLLGIFHAPLLYYFGNYGDLPIWTGIVGLLLFLALMVVAMVFMTNKLLRFNGVVKLRVFAQKYEFNYNINKLLHNVTVIAVFIIFLHTAIGSTSNSSIIMRIMYFLFFDVMIIGWVSHKLVRRIRPNTDPYIHRKVSWDNNLIEILGKLDKEWTVKLVKKFPTLYTCIQCGTCTSVCPVASSSGGTYNPRHLVECLLLGLKDSVLNKDPKVWECAQCYSCIENCPQRLEFPEIITYLRNTLAKRGEAPIEFLGEAQVVYDYGAAVPPQPAVVRRRDTLKLPKIPEYDLQEVQRLLNMVKLDKIVKHEDDLDTKTQEAITK